MKKKVLIISYSYPPSNAPAAQRPYAVAKYLDKDKFEVTVISCGNVDSSLGFNAGFDPELPHVRLIRINSLVGRGASRLRQNRMGRTSTLKSRIKSAVFTMLSSIMVPDKAIFWYPMVRKYLREHPELIHETDTVFTTSPAFSNHLTGQFIKSRKKDIFWVSEMRDFHALEKAGNPFNIKQVINSNLERSIIRTADAVTFISYAMKEIYGNQYAPYADKFSVIYNGFDMADFEKLSIAPTTNEKLTVFYAGSFYRGVRSPLPLLQIIDHLIEADAVSADEIDVRIAGNFENELLEEMKGLKSYRCITLLGNIPRSAVLRQLVAADLLWLIVGHKSTHYTGVPIKFFEYLGARRPIVNFAPAVSEPTRIVEEHDLGWNFDTVNFDLDRSAEQFKEIINAHRSGKLRESLKLQFLPQFDRESQGALFATLFSGK